MDESEIKSIVEAVVKDTHFWIAIVGLIGVFVGATITFAGNLLLHYLRGQKQKRLDTRRKELLEQMLRDNRFKEKWRKLTTLSAVVGTPAEETMRLLVELGARGSEKADGKWALLEYHPLDKVEQ